MGCESKTRELARRLSGGDEILLLWNPRDGHVEVSVRDVATGIGFDLEVAPGNALDAFQHPFAYASALGRQAG
jgi:hypothetical protein